MDTLSFPPNKIRLFRCELNESFSILLNDAIDPQTPIGDILFEPLQIGILRLTSEYAKLYVQSHEALEINLNGPIDDATDK